MGQLDRIALRQAEMTGSGNFKNLRRSSMCRERDAKRVVKGGADDEDADV